MSDTATVSGTPDWSRLSEALPCPRCGYDLRMLPQPRCPECGLEFAWSEVIGAGDPRQCGARFEYRWQAEPLRSFCVALSAYLKLRAGWVMSLLCILVVFLLFFVPSPVLAAKLGTIDHFWNDVLALLWGRTYRLLY